MDKVKIYLFSVSILVLILLGAYYSNLFSFNTKEIIQLFYLPLLVIQVSNMVIFYYHHKKPLNIDDIDAQYEKEGIEKPKGRY